MAINAIIAVVTAMVLSSVIHVFTYIGDGKEAFTSDVVMLFDEGAKSIGGGVVGGLLSYAFVAILNIGGTIFVLLALLIPLVTFLLGTTPVDVAIWIGKKIKAAMAKNAEIRREIKEEKALEAKERLEEERLERAARRAEERAERAEQREKERLEREAEREAAKLERQKSRELEEARRAEELADAIAGDKLSDIRNLGKKSENETKTKLLEYCYEYLTEREQVGFLYDVIERNYR